MNNNNWESVTSIIFCYFLIFPAFISVDSRYIAKKCLEHLKIYELNVSLAFPSIIHTNSS